MDDEKEVEVPPGETEETGFSDGVAGSVDINFVGLVGDNFSAVEEVVEGMHDVGISSLWILFGDIGGV